MPPEGRRNVYTQRKRGLDQCPSFIMQKVTNLSPHHSSCCCCCYLTLYHSSLSWVGLGWVGLRGTRNLPNSSHCSVTPDRVIHRDKEQFIFQIVVFTSLEAIIDRFLSLAWPFFFRCKGVLVTLSSCFMGARITQKHNGLEWKACLLIRIQWKQAARSLNCLGTHPHTNTR